MAGSGGGSGKKIESASEELVGDLPGSSPSRHNARDASTAPSQHGKRLKYDLPQEALKVEQDESSDHVSSELPISALSLPRSANSRTSSGSTHSVTRRRGARGGKRPSAGGTKTQSSHRASRASVSPHPNGRGATPQCDVASQATSTGKWRSTTEKSSASHLALTPASAKSSGTLPRSVRTRSVLERRREKEENSDSEQISLRRQWQQNETNVCADEMTTSSQGVTSDTVNDDSVLSVLVADPPSIVSSAFLEISLRRGALIDDYFDVAEQMLLATGASYNDKDTKYGIIEEQMYQWITHNRAPRYRERFTREQRRVRSEALRTYRHRRRLEYRDAILKLSLLPAFGDLQNGNAPDILSCSHLPNIAPTTVSHPPDSKPLSHKQASRSTTESADSDAAWLDSWIREQKQSCDRRATLPRCSQIEFLQSRVVRMSPIVEWSPREVALFQLALCTYGPDFYAISKRIGTKSYKEAYTFYAEVFKQTQRYQVFKEFKKYADWWHAAQQQSEC